jgi:hypothetical protein
MLLNDQEEGEGPIDDFKQTFVKVPYNAANVTEKVTQVTYLPATEVVHDDAN